MAETNDTLKPYTGPPPSPNNFAEAYPHLETRIVRGMATLDQDTQDRLDTFKRQTRSNPPKPATIINLHPFELQISHSKWTRGIKVPACEAGQPIAFTHVRGWMFDNYYVDGKEGVRDFQLIRPIDRAKEFVQIFNDKEMWGSGVIIYEGESHPDKVGEVETYDHQGTPITIAGRSFEVDDDTGVRTAITVPIPVKKSLAELIREAITARNAHYLRVVQAADKDYRLPDGKGRQRDFNIPRLMAEVLVAEGLISEPPTWNLATRLEKGQAEDNCAACGSAHASEAFKCGCGHILDALAAYENGAIEYGHVSMETMTSDEWDQADKLKAERDRIKAKRMAAGGKKGRTEKPADDES